MIFCILAIILLFPTEVDASENRPTEANLFIDIQQAQKDKYTKKVVSAYSSIQKKPAVDRFLVKFKSNNRQKSSSLPTNLRVVKRYRAIENLQLVEIPSGDQAEKVFSDLKVDPNVEYIEKDQPIYLRAIPDDEKFSELWSLHNNGDSYGIEDADINATEAWELETGDSDIVLAIIDTGIDYTHEDLKDNIWTNSAETPDNGIDDDGNGYIDDIFGIDVGDGDADPMDIVGHGTHIAGTIAAKGNNNKGIAGINWEAKLLSCKLFGYANDSLSAFVSSAVECLDYILDLKLNKGINIVATNNSWGWSGNESEALKEAIKRHSDAGILFVAAAGNRSTNNNMLDDYPSSFYLPNVISVASSNERDRLSYFSNFGSNTVHVVAPGDDILSTVPGNSTVNDSSENPFTDIYYEDVESGNGNWIAESPWEISEIYSHTGFSSWSDSISGNYENNINASLISPEIDLSNITDKVVLGFYAKIELEGGFDNVLIEMSNESENEWLTVGQLTGEVYGWNFYHYVIPEKLKKSTFKFRFHIVTDGVSNFDGIHIDNIGIGIDATEENDGSNRYDTYSGTSMAAPHVTGLLGLLKAQDSTRTMTQLKNLVMAGGTPKAHFEDSIISGRRLRAWDVDGQGAMNCENQTIFRRLRPASTSKVLNIDRMGEGAIINFSFLNINCDKANVKITNEGTLSATIVGTDEVITLKDDGKGFDQLEGDGIYSAQFDPSNIDTEIIDILLPDETTVSVRLVDQYSFIESYSHKWREISAIGNKLALLDDKGDSILSPFPIMYGDDPLGFRKIFISDNGLITLFQQFEGVPFEGISFINTQLPTQFTQRIISPYWFDLYGPGGNIYWAILGEEPNRELVIQWDDMPAFGSRIENFLTFQVVLFENSSNIVFNYQDVDFGIPVINNGGISTVGVQMNSSLAQTYSYDTPSLSNGKSIVWYMGEQYIDNTSDNRQESEDSSSWGSLSEQFIYLLIFTYILTGKMRETGMQFFKMQCRRFT